jgi:hypothetical protein
MYKLRYILQNSDKTEIIPQILMQLLNNKFHENSFGVAWVVKCPETDNGKRKSIFLQLFVE